MTELQIEMLSAIAESEYQPTNGCQAENYDDLDWVWAEFIIDTQQDKGTFASLVNAKMAEHNRHPDRKEACVRLTAEGFKAYKTNQVVN